MAATTKKGAPTKRRGKTGRAKLVSALSHQKASAHLVMAWHESPPYYRAQYVDIDADVSAQFLKLARDTAGDLAKGSEIPYDVEWPLKSHEFFRLNSGVVPATDLFKDLGDFLNLDRFHKSRLTKPRLYVVPVQTPQGTALFGRKMAYLKVLGRDGKTFSAVWDGNSFSKLEKSVATFSKDFDWIFWDDALYVVNAARFHAEFRDNAAVRAAVEDHVKTITQHISIKNADKFVERCQAMVPMASKLEKVASGGIWKESVADLKKYADRYAIDVAWDGDSLVFDDGLDSQWNILKLLDEDRTRGPVSGRHYESSAKRAVS